MERNHRGAQNRRSQQGAALWSVGCDDRWRGTDLAASCAHLTLLIVRGLNAGQQTRFFFHTVDSRQSQFDNAPQFADTAKRSSVGNSAPMPYIVRKWVKARARGTTPDSTPSEISPPSPSHDICVLFAVLKYSRTSKEMNKMRPTSCGTDQLPASLPDTDKLVIKIRFESDYSSTGAGRYR